MRLLRPARCIPVALAALALAFAAAAHADYLVSTGVTEDSSRVVRYADDGRYLGVFICPGNGLSVPRGMKIGPDGKLYVASFANGRVLRYDATTGAFDGVFVPTGAGGLRNPDQLLFLGGILLVTDFHAGAVRRYDSGNGTPIGDLVPAGVGGLGGADDITLGPDDRLYVSSAGTGEVLRYDLTGAFDRVFATGDGMIFPRGLAFDASGNLLVNDSGANRIVRFKPDGTVDATFAPGAPLEGPRGLVLDANGRLVLGNQYGPGVLRYDADGTFHDEFSTTLGRPDREPAFLLSAAGIHQIRARMVCPPEQSAAPGADIMLTYCMRNAGCAPESFHYAFADTKNWIVSVDPAANGDLSVQPGGEFCVTVTVRPPANAAEGEIDAHSWEGYPAQETEGLDRCITNLTVSAPTPVLLSRFTAEATPGRVRLSFSIPDERGLAGVEVYRAEGASAGYELLNQQPLALDGHGTYEWMDSAVRAGASYRYQLGLLEAGGQEIRMGLASVTVPAPVFALGRPAPNPTARGVSVRVALPVAAKARLRVLDLGGRVVRSLVDGELAAGEQDVAWDGRDDGGRAARSGVYFLVFESGPRRAVARFVVMR
jgi:sugar lactone lactonase YvrE